MIKHWLGALVLKVFGWRVEGAPPSVPKYVMIAAPHTSNWDLPLLIAFAFYYKVHVSWLGKHTIFKPPFGAIMRWLGGISVDRRGAHNMVARVVEIIDGAETIVVAVPPEGTRKKVQYWKSGFYHIAAGAKVPIVLSFLDYKRKVGGVGPAILPSGDVHADMDRIREFYRDVRGRFPDKENVPRLREEDVPAAA